MIFWINGEFALCCSSLHPLHCLVPGAEELGAVEEVQDMEKEEEALDVQQSTRNIPPPPSIGDKLIRTCKHTAL